MSLEVRLHGRGGQGAVVASKILAETFFRMGNHVQSFPMFGVERRGAPVSAFFRIEEDGESFLKRSEIDSPDIIIVLDPVLMDQIDPFSGLSDNGVVLLNHHENPDQIQVSAADRLASVDASSIALENDIGSASQPIVNTAMTGAFVRIINEEALDMLLESISEVVPKYKQRNKDAARQAFQEVRVPQPDLFQDARGIVWNREWD